MLENALDALSRALTDAGAPWMIIGGIAIIARGVRRFTTDIDAAVRGDAIRPEALLADAPEVLDGFDAIVSRASGPARPVKKAGVRRARQRSAPPPKKKPRAAKRR